LLPVVGHDQRHLVHRIAARFDDLERRVDHIDRGADLFRGDLAFEAPAKAHAQLGLEAGMDQFGSAEHVTGRPSFQDASE
jgi:hypothetical protein